MEEKSPSINQRTEEVQSIVERMPTHFALAVSAIVIVLFILLFTFGWLIRYPDVVTGQIVLNANSAPLKLVVNVNGKLKLGSMKSMSDVKEGQIIAYIENPTNPKNVKHIDSLLKMYNPNTDQFIQIQHKLPHNFSLGELNGKYYTFSNSLQEFINYKQDRRYEKQDEGLYQILAEQKNAIANAEKRVEMGKNSLSYVHKFYLRDSIMFAKKVISESELDKTQVSYLSSKDSYQNALNNLITAKQAARQTESKLQDLGIEKPEKEKELRIALIAAYNDLIDNIKIWEQKYVFKAPFKGKVQFLKFYTNNQYVQTGEAVFTVLPEHEQIFGQLTLPAIGSGKIKIGQEVIVKLDNYPYVEYGSITGRVNSISLTASTQRTEKNEVDTYLILVDFPHQLKTNYGTQLDFKAESKGMADVVTADRRLIERLFDNLKYMVKK